MDAESCALSILSRFNFNDDIEDNNYNYLFLSILSRFNFNRIDQSPY